MPFVAKRIKAWAGKIQPGKQYPIDEALALVQGIRQGEVPESVDVAVNLGIDASKSDQQVRGSTVMPHGIGKSVRVAVFTSRQEPGRRARRRRRHRRPGRSGREGEGGRDEFRRGRREPRCDARRRPARPDPRPARPDAEPEGRHRDAERRRCGEERQGRSGALPLRQGRRRSLHDRQGGFRADRSSRKTCTRCCRTCRRPSRRPPRASI